MMDNYLEILAGHVFDHDKLVTYKWLSKELEVHVNIAKQMLWEFYEKHRDNGSIECTYLLIGILKENGMRVEVVRESDLSKAKEKFSKIISEHVYSVHKPLEDLELLASSDTSGDVKFSAIKCDACVERNDEEMHHLRWGTAALKITEEKIVNSKPVEPVKIDKKPAAVKKNGFNNFFNTAGKQKSPETSKASKTAKDSESENKSNSLSNSTDLTEKNKSSEKNKSPLEKSKGTMGNSKSKKTSSKVEETNKTKKGGLESFFGKMSSFPKPAEVKVLEKKEEEIKVPEKKEEEVKAPEKKKEEVFETKKVKEKEKPRAKKRVRSQGSDREAKKRKRIVVQSDSSDSEAQSDMDVEEPMPEAVAETETPIRPKSPSPPAVRHENGKRKVLKMVNETYKDDRGFIVTKKVHVYVSCSEDEEEKEKKKEKGPPPKKAQTKVDNAKKKQSVLTKFFSKAS